MEYTIDILAGIVAVSSFIWAVYSRKQSKKNDWRNELKREVATYISYINPVDGGFTGQALINTGNLIKTHLNEHKKLHQEMIDCIDEVEAFYRKELIGIDFNEIKGRMMALVKKITK